MDFVTSMILGNGTFWLLCTFAAGLAVLRHHTSWPLVSALAVALNGIVIVMLVGGWVFPMYLHTWEPAMFNFGVWWMVPMLMWIYSGFSMPAGAHK